MVARTTVRRMTVMNGRGMRAMRGRGRRARSMGRGPAEARSRRGAGRLVASAVVLGGCTVAVGGVPRLEQLDPAQGYKMLRPSAAATVCGSQSLFSSAPPDDLLATAFRELLARDDEAT